MLIMLKMKGWLNHPLTGWGGRFGQPQLVKMVVVRRMHA
jgi:hypothetical protein